jgi:hypothetical protein
MIRPNALKAGALALLIAGFGAGPALAQKAPDLATIMSRLKVTPEETPIVQAVVSDNLERHAAIERNARAEPGGADPRRVASELNAERERSETRLQGVLDESQMEEWGRIQDELDANVLVGERP